MDVESQTAAVRAAQERLLLLDEEADDDLVEGIDWNSLPLAKQNWRTVRKRERSRASHCAAMCDVAVVVAAAFGCVGG